jgi:hypothetical protein
MFCPFCGGTGELQQFNTREQLEHLHNTAGALAQQAMHRGFAADAAALNS